MTALNVLLIDNYDSFTYNLAHLLRRLDSEVAVVRNDQVSVDDVAELRPDAIVISPGPSRPERAGISVDLVRRLGATVPILGVCLGHQAIGVAFGARVAPVEPVHGKRSTIHHSGRGVFRGLPSPIHAARYHSLAIQRASIPPELEVTAWSPDGIPMAIAHREHPLQGLQFHPESILTDDGEALVASFLAQSVQAVAGVHR
jgi:anthranilate synthase component 2